MALFGKYKTRDEQIEAQLKQIKGKTKKVRAKSIKPKVKSKKSRGGMTSEELWLQEQLKKARAGKKK